MLKNIVSRSIATSNKAETEAPKRKFLTLDNVNSIRPNNKDTHTARVNENIAIYVE